MCANVFVCCRALTVSAAWMSETVINTWASRNAQTPALDCIYGPDWDDGSEGGGGGGGSCTARLWLWRGSNQNTRAGKPPLDESQGAVERTECRPGFRGSGVRPVVNEINPLGLSASEPLMLPHQPQPHCQAPPQPQWLDLDYWGIPHFLNSAHITLCPWDDPINMSVSWVNTC